MAEPTLKFFYNHGVTDVPYNFYTGHPNWREIEPGVDKIIFSGGRIGDVDEGMGSTTLVSGTRSPTIRPSSTSYVIPYVYVESGDTMYYVQLAGHNTNKYVFGVSVSGTIEGNCYLEAWDDNSFSTYVLPVLSGTSDSSYMSYVNAIRTTDQSPPWHPYWDGSDIGAAYLRGQQYRVGLGTPPATSINDEMLFYNIYIRLEIDSPTFHNVPILAFRYLYS